MSNTQVSPVVVNGGGGGGGGGGGSTPGWNDAAVYTSSPGQYFFPMTGMDATIGKHMVVKNGLILLVGPDYDYIIDENGVWLHDPLVGGDTVVIYC